MEPARSNLPHDVERNTSTEPSSTYGNPIHNRIREVELAPDDSVENTNIVSGSLWMVGITLALFFLPAINGLIGGAVGGYKVGNLRKAMMAAVLPAILAAAGLWVILTSLDFPILGLFAGVALGVHIVLSEIGIFVGAAIGGVIAQNKINRLNRA